MKTQQTGNGPETRPDETALNGLNPVSLATDACLSMWKNASKIQSEMLRFVNNRMEKDFAHPVRLMNCKKPEEFIEAQFDFANTLFNDYAKESRWIGEMMREIGREAQGNGRNSSQQPG